MMRWSRGSVVLALTVVAACGGGPTEQGGGGGGSTKAVSVQISPRVDTVQEVYSVQFTARVLDAQGHGVPGAPVTWWTLDTVHARVDANGKVTGTNLGRGTARIHAVSGTLLDSVTVVVIPRPVTTVEVRGATTLLAAESTVATVALRDSLGRLLDPRPLLWATTGPKVLTVGQNGVVQALTGGNAVVQVTSEGVTGQLPIQVLELQFDSLWAGETETCGLEASGALWCWGPIPSEAFRRNASPALARAVPARVAGYTFRTAAIGGDHDCGITTGGATYCWGANDLGQIGLGVESGDAVGTVVGAPSFVRLYAGGRHSCGLTAAGAAWCWGDNNVGQLGVGDSTRRPAPTPVAGGLQFSSLGLGGDYSCGTDTGGIVYCWGAVRAYMNPAPDTACGENCLAPTLMQNTPVLARLVGSLCGVDSVGTARCFGFGFGNSPVGTDHTWLSLASSFETICGVATDGEAYCYGVHPNGLYTVNFPSDVPALPLPGHHPFTMLAPSYAHTCGLAAGQAWCAGYNQFYELGTYGPWSSDTLQLIIGHPRP